MEALTAGRRGVGEASSSCEKTTGTGWESKLLKLKARDDDPARQPCHVS